MAWATDGERARALAYLLVAVVGAWMSFVIVTNLDNPDRPFFQPLTGYETWQIAAGAIGAIVGLALSGELLGQSGRYGWKRAIWGGVFVSFVGALVAGTLVLPLFGTMFGPFSLFVALVGRPLLAVVWIAHLAGAHWLLRRWRQERDSIFNPLPGKPRVRRTSDSPLRLKTPQDWLDDEDAALAALENARKLYTPEDEPVEDAAPRPVGLRLRSKRSAV
ncbi:hypothetical protein [Pelagovum pacificum]|uniref:Uncharacterized protein n=1 Tax=Pelagovum pacificum TaxID=2588711 RepID=A0A5C5GA01_9RHOB|nr:hypothetical protein [Pelagovum pacificum]TNY30865.1 hypothetical protein FHY64_17300 [Pelagovum pacificum]